MMGRDFTAADNQPGAEKVAIIGYGIWQRDFGGAPDIVGKGVRINGKPATIIGVMPKGFAFPTNEELWIPLFSEFPPQPAQRPGGNINPAVLGAAEARRVARSGQRRVRRRLPSGSPPRIPTPTSSSTPARSSR